MLPGCYLGIRVWKNWAEVKCCGLRAEKRCLQGGLGQQGWTVCPGARGLVRGHCCLTKSRHVEQPAMHCTVSWVCSGCHDSRPLSLAGQYAAQAKQITEALPPEVKVKDDLSLPADINSYPFSSFIKSHFQVGTLFFFIASQLDKQTSSSGTRNKVHILSLCFFSEDRFPCPWSSPAAALNTPGSWIPGERTWDQ